MVFGVYGHPSRNGNGNVYSRYINPYWLVFIDGHPPIRVYNPTFGDDTNRLLAIVIESW